MDLFDKKDLEDCERATIFLYVASLPIDGLSRPVQIQALALIAGWDLERAEEAFLEAEDRGLATTEVFSGDTTPKTQSN